MRRLCALFIALTACNADAAQRPAPPDAPAALRAVEVVSGLSSPLFMASPPDDDRLFVVEQAGRIRIVRNGAILPRPFLDITADVSSGGERGLFSVAFDPDYRTSGHFWVNYTDRNGDTKVERYRVSADADVADPASASLVLAVDQPFSNHNGGLVTFGPDGMLYIGMGDGGDGGDPQNHGQNPASLLGALLRIDARAAQPYAIPADNPFRSGAGGRPEVWATGLRNPWRFSFDPPAGLLFIADVGQSRWEEVNARPAGDPALNYGWNIMEGRHCYRAEPCATQGLVLPVLEYDHDDGCSITGGYVYRGRAIPGLVGHYFFADYCRGWVRSFRIDGGTAVDLREWDLGPVGQITSFGQDASGELHIVSTNGRIYRLEAG